MTRSSERSGARMTSLEGDVGIRVYSRYSGLLMRPYLKRVDPIDRRQRTRSGRSGSRVLERSSAQAYVGRDQYLYHPQEPVGFRKASLSNSVALTLAQVAGVRRDALAQAKTDIPRFAALGAALVSTAVVAAASFAVALSTVMSVPIYISSIIGLIWGLIVFNLDRLMVQTMRGKSRIMLLLQALPRGGVRDGCR